MRIEQGLGYELMKDTKKRIIESWTLVRERCSYVNVAIGDAQGSFKPWGNKRRASAALVVDSQSKTQ
jgi:hypothetical protein